MSFFKLNGHFSSALRALKKALKPFQKLGIVNFEFPRIYGARFHLKTLHLKAE
jgi:hypothetical protein